jgi:hypothetical protein
LTGGLGALVLLILASPDPRRGALEAGAAGLGAGALGLAVLLPAWLLLPHTSRSLPFAYEQASLWSLHPARALELLVPWPWDGAFPDLAYRGRALLAGDRVEPFADTLYVGPVALLLAGVGLRRRGRAARGLVALAAVCVVLALGRHTPLHRLVSDLPLLASLRYPEKWIALPTLTVWVLAGRGLRGPLPRTGVWCGVLGVAVLLPVVLVPLAARLPGPPDVDAVWLGAGRAAVLLVAAAGVGLFAHRLGPHRAALALTLLALLDPLAANRRRIYLADDPRSPATTAEALAGEGWAGGRVATLPVFEALPGAPGRRTGYLDALARRRDRLDGLALSRIPAFTGFASWSPRRTVAAVTGLPGQEQVVLRLFAVRVLVAPRDLPAPDWLTPSPVALADPDLRLWDLHDPLPMAWLVPRAGTAVVADQTEALERMNRPRFDPRQHTVLEGARLEVGPLSPPDPLAVWPERPEAGGMTGVVLYRPDRVVVEVLSDEAVTLLVSRLAVPGWRAETSEGAPLDVFPASATILGVPLEAGQHTVTLTYRTPGLGWGALLSGLALLVALGLGLAQVLAGPEDRGLHRSGDEGVTGA